jgi:eukaryotic-like serine/threonine-protein kinase
MGTEYSDSSPPGRVVGRYRICAELAAGGMATVHLGCLIGPGGFSKLVAIKSLHPDLASEPDFVSMFLDEARLASSIHHPNVVPSLDVVAEGGELWVVMDYVHGETLAGLLRLGKQQKLALPVPIPVRLLCDTLEGLHAAHTASRAGQCLSIVHRDVSPQNIMVGADGNARVLDFGIAKAALRSRVTAAGTIKGKLAYMSPEQVRGQDVDARTDVFAAGVVLWEALTGQRLFWAADNRTVIDRLLKAPIAAPSELNPSLSRGLDSVVLKALARDRSGRFQTAREFAEALRRASPEASRGEIALWVARVAEAPLAKRLELLHAVESSAMHLFTGPRAAGTSRPSAATLPALTSRPPTAGRGETATRVEPHRPSSSLPRLAPSGAAATGLLAALAVLLGAKYLPAPSPLGQRVGLAGARAQSTPPPATAVPRDQPALAEPRPLSAPSELPALEGGDPAVPATASVARPPTSAEAKPERALAAPSASPPSASRRIVAKPPIVVQLEPTPLELPAVNACNPPYRVDASGVRRVKPECL